MHNYYNCPRCGREGFSVGAHECPATPPPAQSESWEEYKSRVDSYSSAWRKKNNRLTNYHVTKI